MTVLAGILACFAALTVLGAVEILARELRAMTAAAVAQAYATMKSAQALEHSVTLAREAFELQQQIIAEMKRRPSFQPTVYQ